MMDVPGAKQNGKQINKKQENTREDLPRLERDRRENKRLSPQAPIGAHKDLRPPDFLLLEISTVSVVCNNLRG